MASGSTTPTSAGSYSDADVRAQSVRQAEVNKMKVAQLDELLRKKGVKPKGVKEEKAMEVAWHYTLRGRRGTPRPRTAGDPGRGAPLQSHRCPAGHR